MRDRRTASQGNWVRGRESHTIGDTKPTLESRVASRRAKAKRARKSRRTNRR